MLIFWEEQNNLTEAVQPRRVRLFDTGIRDTPRTHEIVKTLLKPSFPLFIRKLYKNYRFIFLPVQNLGCLLYGGVCGGPHIEFCGLL